MTVAKRAQNALKPKRSVNTNNTNKYERAASMHRLHQKWQVTNLGRAYKCLHWKVRFLFIFTSWSYDFTFTFSFYFLIISLNKLMKCTITVTETLWKLSSFTTPLQKLTIVLK